MDKERVIGNGNSFAVGENEQGTVNAVSSQGIKKRRISGKKTKTYARKQKDVTGMGCYTIQNRGMGKIRRWAMKENIKIRYKIRIENGEVIEKTVSIEQIESGAFAEAFNKLQVEILEREIAKE
jgi:hypothetical protein